MNRIWVEQSPGITDLVEAGPVGGGVPRWGPIEGLVTAGSEAEGRYPQWTILTIGAVARRGPGICMDLRSHMCIEKHTGKDVYISDVNKKCIPTHLILFICA